MKKEVITLITNAKSLPLSQVGAANDSFKMLVDAYSNYKTTVQVEKTKRTVIEAWRETKVLELNNQREILEIYLKETFKERAKNIEGFFATLDKGIDSGNDNLIEQSIRAILAIAKQSPLAEAKELINAMRDPNVRSIEI